MIDDRLARWRREVRRVAPGADSDLVDEIAQHADDRWTAARSAGTDPAACDQEALREIASWQGMTIPSRRRRWSVGSLWSGLGHDVRYSTRALRARPIFTIGAGVLTAIAVGTGIVAFAIVHGILWRPLPYPDADRLTVLWQVRQGQQGQVSYPDFKDAGSAAVFDAAAAMSGGRGSLRVGDTIERVNVLDVEADGYSMLGARALLGRLLDESDSGKPNILVSHRLWRGALGSDPSIIGRMLWVSGREYTVVGVLQPGFDFELPIAPMLRLEKQDLWTMFDRGTAVVNRRDVTTYEALLRMAPGVTLDQARAAVEATSRRLAVDYPATNADRSLRLAALKDEVIAPVRRPLRLVALASIITLLIAMANATILALMRASDRASEMAIRQALGAGVLRLHRQILVESVLVAAAGALGGLIAARPILTAILTNDALRIPRAGAITISGVGVLYGIAIALSIAGVLALVPLGLRHSSVLLRSGARVARGRLRVSRHVTVAAELALALVLCSAGALLGLSLARLLGVDVGFDPRGALAVRVSAYAARYPTLETVQSLFDSIDRSLESMPDVDSAAAGSSLPLSGQTSGTGVLAEGQPSTATNRLTAGWQFVTPGYFATLRIPLRSGRDFTEADNRHSGHVTIINEHLARRLFGAESAIGKRIGVGGGEASGDWHEIIGVVADVRHNGLDTAAAPRVYDLFGEHWGRTLYVVARSKMADPSVLMGPTRRTIHTIDPEAPVFEATTVDALVARSAGPRRIAAILAGSLALTALLLALVGVYAVSAASVAERTREIAIRTALGAAPRDLVGLLAREAAASAIVGAAIGTAASVGMARVIESQLFGVRSADVSIIIAVACLVLAGAAAGAAFPPARRAATADPVLAMRAE